MLRPEAVSFRYQLEGYDEGWIAAGPVHEAAYAHSNPDDVPEHIDCQVVRHVVLDDAVPTEHPAQDAEPEDGCQFGTLDRESQYQRRVAYADRDQGAQEPADDDGSPGQFRIGAVPDNASRFCRGGAHGWFPLPRTLFRGIDPWW